MAFFPFGRKIDSQKEYSLEDIPLFSALSPPEKKIVEKKIRQVEFRRGDHVYTEGTPSEAFYIVVSGRFRLLIKSRAGKGEDEHKYFYRGDHFGEISLLTDHAHSGTVEAVHDGVLLKIEKDDFLKMVNEIPAISLYLNRAMGHRLLKNAERQSRHEVKIAALYSKNQSPEAFEIWLDLCAHLHDSKKRKVLFVDFLPPVKAVFQESFKKDSASEWNLLESDPSSWDEIKKVAAHHPSGFQYLRVPAGDSLKDEKKVTLLLTFLTYRFDFLMLRMPDTIYSWVFKVLKQSDHVYVYSGTQSDELAENAEAAKAFQETCKFGTQELKILVPEETEKTLSYEEKEKILGRRIFSIIPSKAAHRGRYDQALKFLSKDLSETLLGLALGSGAAYGLAHIGVLRVLEREGIFPDVIAGSSIGALVGGFWAAGYHSEELEKIAKSIDKRSGFFKLLGFQDMSIAHHGFFKGNQVARFFEQYLGDRNIEDLSVPVKIIAANLFTSEEVVLETGRLVDAIRASSSIPGIFRPVHHQGQYLIDGGVVDPLPVRVLSSMGVKKIIGVNVLPGSKDRIERNRVREELRREQKIQAGNAGFFNRILNQGLDKVYDRYAVNIFNVIMSTIQFMEFEMAQSSASQTDVYIHPIVKEAHWAEFYNPDKFIRCGEEKTLEKMSEIQRLLKE